MVTPLSTPGRLETAKPRHVPFAWAGMLAVVSVLTWSCIPSHHSLGRSFLESGDDERARTEMLAALAATPAARDQASIREELSRIALLAGDVPEAFAQCREAVREAPESMQALVRLSVLEEMTGDMRQAMDSLERAYALEGSWRRAGRPRTAELLREVEDGSGVTARAELVSAHERWFAPHLRRLAFFERWFQRLEPALAVHRDLVNDRPGDLVALAALLRMESYSGNRDRARKVLETMVALRPRDAGFRQQLAERYTWARRPDLAAEQFSEAGLPPDEARRRTLSSYVEAGRADEALAGYQRSCPEDKDERARRLALSVGYWSFGLGHLIAAYLAASLAVWQVRRHLPWLDQEALAKSARSGLQWNEPRPHEMSITL